MKLQEHRLTIVGEECNEIAKCCSKALRFGLYHIEETKTLTNRDKIIAEFNDLCAGLEDLLDMPITEIIDDKAIMLKREKVKKFLEYSKQLNTLTLL